MDKLIEIGKNLRRRRKELGYSQEYVALTLYTNTTRISHIENGKVIPDILEIINYCELFVIDIKSLLNISEKSNFSSSETDKIIDGIKVLDQTLSLNDSKMLKKWFKSIHNEVSEIIEETKLLNQYK